MERQNIIPSSIKPTTSGYWPSSSYSRRETKQQNRCFSKADIEKGKICLLQRLVCCSSSARNRSMRAGWCCDPLRGLRGCSSRSPSCAPRSACLAVFRAFGESCSLVCSGTTEKEADRTIVLVWALSGRAIYPMQISRLVFLFGK